MTERRRPTTAHRVSLAISLILLAAVTLVLLAGLSQGDPAWPVAEIAEVRTLPDGTRHVLVDVTNEGERAAEGVQVSASLTIAGEEQTGDQTIDFLGGGERRTVVFVFESDPAAGELEIGVSSFTEP